MLNTRYQFLFKYEVFYL